MKLEKYVDILSGYAFKSKLFNTEKKGIPIIRIRDVTSNAVSTYYDGQYKNEYLIENGDLLIGMDGRFNLIEWEGGKALLNQRVCKITPRVGKVDKNFIKHLLPKSLKEIEDRTSFVTVKHLSVKDIKEINLPKLPLTTQIHIASILDDAAALRDKTAQLLKEYGLLAQSIFLDMFGDPVKNTKSFKKGKIRDLVKDAKYGTSAKAGHEGRYPYLRMNNITYSGYMDYDKLKYVDIQEKDLHKYLVENGDILFNRTNSKELVGKTAVFDSSIKMIAAGYLIRVKLNDQGNPFYVWGYLNSKHGKLVLNNMCKSIVGMANINAQELQNIKVLLPPIHLQNQFAEKIALIEQQKELAKQELKESEDLFNCLLQKAFKGELIQKEEVNA